MDENTAFTIRTEHDRHYDEKGPSGDEKKTYVMLLDKFRSKLLRDLTPAELKVLLCLALHCNEQMTCWPSLNLIAKETGYSKPTVLKALDDLYERGMVEKTTREKEDGSPDSNLYQIKSPSMLSRGSKKILPHSGEGSKSELTTGSKVDDTSVVKPTLPEVEPNLEVKPIEVENMADADFSPSPATAQPGAATAEGGDADEHGYSVASGDSETGGRVGGKGKAERKERSDENLDTDHPHGRGSRDDGLGVRNGQPAISDSVADVVPDGRGHDDSTGSADPVVEAIIEQAGTHPDQFDLGRNTEAKREEAGAWTAPPPAGGDDGFQRGPVDAFCEVLAAILPVQLPQGKRRSWGDKLHEIAKEWSTDELVITPDIMERAIRAIPDDSEIGWKSFSSPYSDNFDQNIGPLLLRNAQPRRKKSGRVPDPGKFDEATRMTLERLGHGHR